MTDSFNGGFLHQRIADDAALPYLLPSCFELWFNQNDDLAAADVRGGGNAAATTEGRTRVAEMKDTSITTTSTSSPTCSA